MNDGQRLSFGEFLADLRGVVVSPRRRFLAIHERGAMWGSVLLLLAPAYFTMPYLGGIYFDRDPIPGYSFILPLIGAACLTLLKLFGIHSIARLFEGKWHYRAGTGKYRDLFVVFGYSGLPSILALLAALVLFIGFPNQIATLFRNFRVIATSVLVAIGIALFIWNLILMTLALRTVYPIRDFKLVISFLLGPVLATIPLLATALVVSPAHIDFPMVAPLLNEKVLRFAANDPDSQTPGRNKISFHIDILAYELKNPKRFELVAFTPVPEGNGAERPERGHLIFGSMGSHLWFSELMNRQLAGRIVGLPGDEVDLSQSKLRINGQFWQEQYIIPECQGDALIPAKKLGPSNYLILPEDRRLIEAYRNQLIVSRDRITGRLIVNRWPIGWCLFRPTAFMKAVPVN